MFKFSVGADAIQFWILILMGLSMLTGAMLWVDARYAKASDVASLTEEVHALYMKLIPEQDRLRPHHRGETQ